MNINLPAKAFLDYVLEDDNSAFGGTSYYGQTLRDFLDEIELSEDTLMWKINKILSENGIKKIKVIL